MKKIFLIIPVLLVLTDCKKKTSLRGDHFIFGSSYSECEGNCASFFMLKEGQLYPDEMSYAGDKLKFKNTPLPENKRNLAKQLEQDLPDLLKQSESTTFGCPDCADQGALHLEIRKNAKITKFSIDADTTKLPAEIRLYIGELKSLLGQL